MKQLTALSSAGVSLQYTYSSSANNGKITSLYDTVSGETVSYTYDSLNRLSTAAATSGGTWSLSFTYDGFGTLTAITGTAAASYSYNPSTNQGYCADANGNTGEVSCAGFLLQGTRTRREAGSYRRAPATARISTATRRATSGCGAATAGRRMR